MNYTLKDVLDVPRLRELLDAMDEIRSMPTAIIDIEGNVLTATAWQDICTKFHRINPDTKKKCIVNDTHINAELDNNVPHNIYRCPMGLVEAATPIIIEGTHLGNVFTGQLFIEPPDEAYFIEQARQYGFDENEYLEAMRRVPLFSEEKLRKNLAFIHSLTQMLAEQGLQDIRQRDVLLALQMSEEFSKRIIASSNDCIKVLDLEGNLLSLSDGGQKLLEIEDIRPYLGLSWVDFWKEDREAAQQVVAKALSGEVGIFHGYCETVKGKPKWWEVVVSPIIGAENKIENLLAVSRDITERKQAEEALRESESRFRSIFNHSPIAIGIGDSDSGLMVEANDAWLRLFGYEREEVIGHTTEELSLYVNSEDRIEIIKTVRDQDRVVNFPIQLRQKSGMVIDIQYSAEFNTLNSKPYLQVMMTDVTDRKRIEKQLEASEENYRGLTGLTSDYVHKCSRTGTSPFRLMWIGGSINSISGYSAEEILEMGCWLPLVHPEDRLEVASYLFSLSPGDLKQKEFRIISKEGQTCWINETSRCQAGEKEGELILYGAVKDITERKQADVQLLLREQALANSERFLKAIIDSEPECIKMLDIDGNLLMMNPAGLKMIDADSFEQVQGQCMFPLITEQHRDDFVSLAQQVFRGIPGTLVFEAIGLKGRHVWLETHAVPFRNEQGEIVALLGVTRDVTERKKLEEERVTLELQLQQSQRLESLGVLAGGIAHDFNNLLAVIIGHCSLAKLRPITAVDNIKPIETAAERAAGLCQQMLAYAGKAHFSKSQIHLNELVGEMVNMSKSSIGQNVKITSDLSSDIPPIIADASQIRQVTMNLIINASEAIGESQGAVIVSLAKRAVRADQPEKDHLGAIISSGWYACLEVTDNGCGMDAETQRRIFEPFYTTKFTGRGLGMSAVLGIIKAHNGALQLFSQSGKGTTFRVYLPIQMTESSEGQSPQHTSQPVPWKGSGTVLLVEDEELVVWVAEAMLEGLGFKVIKASNGKEAMDLYEQNAADITLVVTDIGMPVMDGYALFRELKLLDPKLPIIISSGFGDADVTSKIAREDMAGLIGKPYNFDQLREVLKGVVECTQSAHT
jgi:PAS domain S-box-containing protein